MAPTGMDFFHISYYATDDTIVATTIKVTAKDMATAITIFKEKTGKEPVSCVATKYLSNNRN